MNSCNDPLILNGVATTSPLASAAVSTPRTISGSFQLVSSSGSNAGTLKIQASNDIIENIGVPPTPVNWSDIPNATVTIAAGALGLISVPMTAWAGYRWIRAVWTPSSGAGTITVNMLLMSA